MRRSATSKKVWIAGANLRKTSFCRPGVLDRTSRFEQSATAWTGNDARVLEYGEQELADAADERLLTEALRDGIELFGSRRTLRRLMRPEVRA